MTEKELRAVADEVAASVAGYANHESRTLTILDGLRRLIVPRITDAETWLARFANDSDAYNAGVAAGVAMALAAVRDRLRRRMTPGTNAPITGQGCEDVKDAIAIIEADCGRGELPPHEQRTRGA